jgi:transcriptional regulator with XRE-family HTH domain
MNGIELRENRIKHGLTQEKLGELLGVSKRTVINYEQGEVIPATKSEILHRVFSGSQTIELKEKDDELTSLIIDKLFKSDKFKEKLLDYIKDNMSIIGEEEAIKFEAYLMDFIKQQKGNQQ